MNGNRRILIALGALGALGGAIGCAPNTDVSPELNKAYHDHVKGPKPPPGAVHGGPPPSSGPPGGAPPKTGG
jgi:hypothetical protein